MADVLNVTDETFDEEILNSEIPAMVDFWAEWCGPCKMVSPVVEELAREYKGRIKVGKVNVDSSQMTAADFGIVSIPTLILFKDGREEARIVGVVPKDRIKEKMPKDIKIIYVTPMPMDRYINIGGEVPVLTFKHLPKLDEFIEHFIR